MEGEPGGGPRNAAGTPPIGDADQEDAQTTSPPLEGDVGVPLPEEADRTE